MTLKPEDTRPLNRPRNFVPLSALGRNAESRRDDETDIGRVGDAARDALSEIDAAVARFEAEERERLGLGTARPQYREQTFHDPKSATKAHTTILLSGLTLAQDMLVSGALAGTGYRVLSLDCPDNDALRLGKEFGNRGQCNPTYFTVGNLVKHLQLLRDRDGLTTQEILDRYVFLTAGACGPCRFGMYVTEYRKALRDAGFEGFRVLLFQMAGGIKQASGEQKDGLVMGPSFFWPIAKALFIGDVLNAIAYRIRPFEVEAGATDKALEASKQTLYEAFSKNGNLLLALARVRRTFGAVKVDRLRPKPKVGIIGEFWAMTTEGDGNYRMQRFLQEEGAEVDVQLVTAWILFMVWEAERDTRHRMTLGQDDAGRKGLSGKDVRKKLIMTWLGDKAVRVLFQSFAQLLGLHGYELPDMDEVARIARDFYNNDVRGGEAHMEVAKNILNVLHSKVNMTLSVKPFGCMPSSGVSDGVQSAITELYPEAIFLPIETTGDGAVNVYSRVQMMLFKARKAAKAELDEVLAAYGMTEDEVRRVMDRLPILNHPLVKPPHRHGSTAADMAELVGTLRHPLRGIKRWWEARQHHPEERLAKHLAARA
jgi:predicted nucleotide-binding protein (sugar kinase/HSP70/actin superfamily)